MPASSDTDDPAVPATLLSGVLQRLEQRDAFLATHRTTAELLAALAHPQWEIRAGAVRALGERAEQVPLDVLLQTLDDEHRMVRLAAVRALSKRREDVPLAQLAAALHDSDWEVREVAEEIAERPVHGDPVLNPFEAATAFLRHCWHVFAMQIKVLRGSWWLGTALVMLLSCVLALIALLFMHSTIRDVALLLALFTTVSAATGSAFLYGAEHDEGFELMLTTPTSVRLIMFCRFVWVVGYNLVLAALISILITLLHGGGFWTVIQFWLYPMFLIASFSLALSLLLGSWLSILAGVLLEASQMLHFTNASDGYTHVLMFNTNPTWMNGPLALLLAALCLCLALFWLPRTTLSNAL